MFRTAKPSIFFLILIILISFSSSAQTISTIAGNGVNGFSGDGGQALNASFTDIGGVAVDVSGNKYVCDGNRIRKIDPSGVISTIAGTGVAGFSGDWGPAIVAQINAAYDIVIDNSGNLCFSDYFNDRIRKIDLSTGIITTIAGGGNNLNDGGPATNASLHFPSGLAIDASGNLYIADKIHHRIRKVNTSGIITTVAGTFQGTNGDNGPATLAGLSLPVDVAVNAAGELFIADQSRRIRKVSTSGIITTYAGILNVAGIPEHNTVAVNTPLGDPRDLAVDNSGNVYVSAGYSLNATSYAVYVVNTSGIIKWYAGEPNVAGFAGDGGNSLLAQLDRVSGLTIDMAGDVYISDNWNHRLRRVSNACIYPDVPVVSGNNVICENSSDVYTASSPGATSYIWTLPSGWSGSSTSANINITIGSAQDVVNVKGINSCGEGLSFDYTITPANINSTISSAGTSFCQGQSLALTAVSAYTNYQWRLNGIDISGANSNTYSAGQAGSYSVFITYGTCTETSPPLVVSVNPVPSVSVSGPTFLCTNNTTTLTGTLTTGLTYQWLQNGQPIAGANANVYGVTTVGTYSLVATNSYQCHDTSNNVSISASPVLAEINVQGSDNLCMNNLELYGYAGVGHTYQWQLNGANIPGATSFTYTTGVVGNYSLIVTNGNGCQNSDTFAVAYNTGQAELVLPINDNFCEGLSTNLESIFSNNYTYQWYIDGSAVPGATGATYSANSEGYHYLMVNEGVCVDTSDSVYITVWPLPVPVISVSGGMISVASSYQTYQWYYNGVPVPGGTSSTYYATLDGDYFVEVSDNNGCSNSSNVLSLTPTSVSNTINNSVAILHPNPFSETTTLTINNPLREKHSFILYSIDGRVVRALEFSTQTLRIEREQLPAGLFYYSVFDVNGPITNGKLLVQ